VLVAAVVVMGLVCRTCNETGWRKFERKIKGSTNAHRLGVVWR